MTLRELLSDLWMVASFQVNWLDAPIFPVVVVGLVYAYIGWVVGVVVLTFFED